MADFAYPEPKTRARDAILSHIVQFSLARQVGNQVYAGLSDMRFEDNRYPRVGSLIALGSAPPSKWRLSWVCAVDTNEDGYQRYLLESIEDGELCWWHNVGIMEYNPRTTADYPQWRWTNAQFELNDAWMGKRADEPAGWRLGRMQFNDDGTVDLVAYQRWYNERAPQTWRFESMDHVTDEAMDAFLKTLDGFDVAA